MAVKPEDRPQNLPQWFGLWQDEVITPEKPITNPKPPLSKKTEQEKSSQSKSKSDNQSSLLKYGQIALTIIGLISLGIYAYNINIESNNQEIAQQIELDNQKQKLQADKDAWQMAQGEGTLESYQTYLDNQSEGNFRQQAQQEISDIKAQVENARLAQIEKDKEKLAEQVEAERQRQEQEKTASQTKQPGETFEDCTDCPTMVVIPAGTFQMGSNEEADEKPIHTVNIKQFAMSQTEVTFAQWDACYNAGGCSHKPDDEGWGRGGNRPVINVSWNDAKEYIKWINNKTGKSYRLPSEAEWEYADTAGRTNKYNCGDSICCTTGLNDRLMESSCYYFPHESYTGPGPVKSFEKNEFGLYAMHENVWEWVEDKWHDNYNGAPSDGSAWISGRSNSRVLRGGGSSFIVEYDLKDEHRLSAYANDSYNGIGFRISHDQK